MEEMPSNNSMMRNTFSPVNELLERGSRTAAIPIPELALQDQTLDNKTENAAGDICLLQCEQKHEWKRKRPWHLTSDY
jgi:hypothetical protein